ncbi:hypothetical protein H696_05348 [Fonticula alba]|uniref:Helicase C-terminal domain-containing protein n=1 Tax=Fonticula alba TaxID=691883 RepID=A0A058Z1U2_FONAL|nr:hypothetical protein H696_05348 [Fonticula alba]KCV68096.1 hypothetical protein H696_05348 [Fonticula alba]|eukprot:XP_009497470.1 hypothetical protein H696_05348 [Fonticula alba]
MKILFGLMGLKAAELHGNLTQLQRLEALEHFRDEQVDFLLATDVASRGLDISGIQTVINYSMPACFKTYLHRVGRTARAGQNGCSVTLVADAERKNLRKAIRHAADAVRRRNVPPEMVAKYGALLAEHEDRVKAILEEEKQEKLLATAEMELTRGDNLLKHRDEILSRPAKTWFQSKSEKAAAKRTDAEAAQQKVATKPRSKTDGLSRAKKRKIMYTQPATKDEVAAARAAARSFKKQKRPQKLLKLSDDSGSRRPAAGSKKKGSRGKADFSQDLADARKTPRAADPAPAAPPPWTPGTNNNNNNRTPHTAPGPGKAGEKKSPSPGGG